MSSKNPEPLLSDEEQQALLGALRSEADAGREAVDAELPSPERALQGALSALEVQAKTFTKNTRRLFLVNTQYMGQVTVNTPEVRPHKNVLERLSEGSAIGQLKYQNRPAGMVVIGGKLTAFLLEKRLGASLEDGEDEEVEVHPRESLSSVDRRLLAPVISDFAKNLVCEGAKTDVDVLKLTNILSSKKDLAVTPDFEPFVHFSAAVTLPFNIEDEVHFVFPTQIAVELFLCEGKVDAHAPVSASDRAQVAERIALTEVELVVVLGILKSTVGQVLALKEGDVVRLESVPQNPVDVRVEGVTVLRGMPGVNHGNLAITATSVGA